MRRIVIVAAKKGGAGKSYTSSVFLENARASGRKVSVYDLDGQAGTLAIRYGIGDPTVEVAVEDVRDPNASAVWLDAAYSDADDLLLDVPGGALVDLLRTFDAGPAALLSEIQNAQREIVLASVITHKKDGTATALEAVEIFGRGVHHVIVKNEFFADAGSFVIYDGFINPETGEMRYGSTAEKVRGVGGEVVVLPALNKLSDALVDAESLTFFQAAERADLIGRRAAGNVRYWLEASKNEFANSWLDVEGNVPMRRIRVAS